MITAVDSNVVIDVLDPSSPFREASQAALIRCGDEGLLIACDVVWAELVPNFSSKDEFAERMARLHVRFDSTSEGAAYHAGLAWQAYRDRGGSRQHLVADFLIGGHALTAAHRLLTRDRGVYRHYFPELEVVDPSAPR